MKFIRKKASQEVTTNYLREAKKVYTSADFKVFFKRYLQTYLKWMYEQNQYFADNLTVDEICNYLLHHFIHPVWLQIYLRKQPERILVEIADYIKKYVHNAEQMEIETIIYPQDTYVKKVDWPTLQEHALTKEDISNYYNLYHAVCPAESVPEEDYLLTSALTKQKGTKKK